MKLGLPASGKEMDSFIDSRFGRCQYFIVVDQETLNLEAAENPFKSTDRGAGIQAAQWIADQGVKMVLATTIGPNALKVLKRAGITVITGVNGEIREVVENYRTGRLVNSAAKLDDVYSPSSTKGIKPGLGPSGECVCTKCAASIRHRRGIPCNRETCPDCGSRMRRR